MPVTKKSLHRYNAVIVFGQGPLKPILLEEELTAKQRIIWNTHSLNEKSDPDFHVMQNPHELSRMHSIFNNKEYSDAEKISYITALRRTWQWTGWYATKKWGRQNALAAGSLLLNNKTDTVILSGGKTIPAWHAKENIAGWPTEAEMMADIIVQHYGSLYEKKFGSRISDRIFLENKSTNTLENFAYTIKSHPHLLSNKTKVGLLSVGHHLRRISILAERFSLTKEIYETQAAQDIVDTTQVQDVSKDIKNQFYHTEELCIQALVKPQYLTYWLGYIPLADNPVILQNALNMLNAPEWKESAIQTFEKIGMQFMNLLQYNISDIYQRKPSEYNVLKSKIGKLREPGYRAIPS